MLEQVYGAFEVCVFRISTADGRRLGFTVVRVTVPVLKPFFNTTKQEKEKRRTAPMIGTSDGTKNSDFLFEGTSELNLRKTFLRSY